MISLIKKFAVESTEVLLSFDNTCECYTVDVFLSNCGGKFFTRDYKTKGSAMRSYNSWVAKISGMYERFANVK